MSLSPLLVHERDCLLRPLPCPFNGGGGGGDTSEAALPVLEMAAHIREDHDHALRVLCAEPGDHRHQARHLKMCTHLLSWRNSRSSFLPAAKPRQVLEL